MAPVSNPEFIAVDVAENFYFVKQSKHEVKIVYGDCDPDNAAIVIQGKCIPTPGGS
jgi:hypothetical protein